MGSNITVGEGLSFDSKSFQEFTTKWVINRRQIIPYTASKTMVIMKLAM